MTVRGMILLLNAVFSKSGPIELFEWPTLKVSPACLFRANLKEDPRYVSISNKR